MHASGTVVERRRRGGSVSWIAHTRICYFLGGKSGKDSDGRVLWESALAFPSWFVDRGVGMVLEERKMGQSGVYNHQRCAMRVATIELNQ